MTAGRAVAGLLLLAAPALAGCSRGPQFGEVEGRVTLKGKPLENVRVEFWPEGSGPRSNGVTDNQGKYTLQTDDVTRTGAVVGTHKVVVRDLNPYGDKLVGPGRADKDLGVGKDLGKPNRVPLRYGDAHQSPWQKTVNPGKNTIDLEIATN